MGRVGWRVVLGSGNRRSGVHGCGVWSAGWEGLPGPGVRLAHTPAARAKPLKEISQESHGHEWYVTVQGKCVFSNCRSEQYGASSGHVNSLDRGGRGEGLVSSSVILACLYCCLDVASHVCGCWNRVENGGAVHHLRGSAREGMPNW